jgi:hypothetical protein
MEKIYEKMKQLNIKENNLPENIQAELEMLDEMVESLNNKIEHYEKNGISQDEIDEKTEEDDNNIDIYETKLCYDIEKWHKANLSANSNTISNNSEKKKNGYGWLIFGGIALVLTMGAVNTFKRD